MNASWARFRGFRLPALVALVCLAWAGCSNGATVVAAEEQTVSYLRLTTVEVLTDSPQAGHPIEVLTTIMADEETDDVGVTFYLSPVSGDEEGRTVLDSVVEEVVYPKFESKYDSGKQIGHEFVAKMTVPPEVKAGEYYVLASAQVLPTSESQPEVESYDGQEHDNSIQVGDDLKDTPDLVIADVRAATEVVLLPPKTETEDPKAGTEPMWPST